MTWPIRQLCGAAVCVLLSHSLCAVADNDDDSAGAAQQSALPALDQEQQRAAGIVVAHPLAVKTPERIEALGLVLDPTGLVTDLGDVTAAEAADQAASAELARLRGLYGGGAGASLKMLEAAQAEQAKLHADAQSASARYTLHWWPVAALSAAERRKLLDDSAGGRSSLLRADLPGRHSLGALPRSAVLDVDGVQVPGRVLGVLRQSTELQSVALLIEVKSAPAGFGPGARVPVTLLSAPSAGLMLPRDALLYDENGAYVYKQLVPSPRDPKTRYTPVKVRLLLAYGDGWLVQGVDDDDNVVVHGAGMLWSLQGMGAHAVDDDDD
jgi:hypothetical protein